MIAHGYTCQLSEFIKVFETNSWLFNYPYLNHNISFNINS
jgi:hypothetical protein